MLRWAFQQHSNIIMADNELLDIQAVRNYFLLYGTSVHQHSRVAQNKQELHLALDRVCTWYSNMLQGTCEELQDCL